MEDRQDSSTEGTEVESAQHAAGRKELTIDDYLRGTIVHSPGQLAEGPVLVAAKQDGDELRPIAATMRSGSTYIVMTTGEFRTNPNRRPVGLTGRQRRRQRKAAGRAIRLAQSMQNTGITPDNSEQETE